jgi:hypothetical protein
VRETDAVLTDIEGLDLQDPGSMERLEVLVEELRAREQSTAVVERLLRFIENHPDDDLGAPGPLVHYLERFYRRGYEGQLLVSARRTPTLHNVWMLNRLINGSQGTELADYIAAMRAIATDADTRDDVRQLASKFFTRQSR